MDEGFEYQGHWWTPKKPDEKLPGILRFGSWEGEALSLFGSLMAPEGEDDMVPVLGLSMDDTPITLTNLYRPPSIPGMSPGKRRPGTSKVEACYSGKPQRRTSP